MNVSKSTVQRDLSKLEKQGKINREYGGAVQVNIKETISDLTEGPVLEKLNINVDKKAIIAEFASKEIKDGDLVFIDSGTTSLQLIPFLINRKIKIVTYSYIFLAKMGQLDTDIYMLGGKYNRKHEICYGTSTIEQLKDFRFDKAFITANGADCNLKEVYTSEIDVGNIKKAAMKRSKKSYLLIDDSKFNITGLSTFAYFNEFEKIFTNSLPDNSKKHKNIVITKK